MFVCFDQTSCYCHGLCALFCAIHARRPIIFFFAVQQSVPRLCRCLVSSPSLSCESYAKTYMNFLSNFPKQEGPLCAIHKQQQRALLLSLSFFLSLSSFLSPFSFLSPSLSLLSPSLLLLLLLSPLSFSLSPSLSLLLFPSPSLSPLSPSRTQMASGRLRALAKGSWKGCSDVILMPETTVTLGRSPRTNVQDVRCSRQAVDLVLNQNGTVTVIQVSFDFNFIVGCALLLFFRDGVGLSSGGLLLLTFAVVPWCCCCLLPPS